MIMMERIFRHAVQAAGPTTHSPGTCRGSSSPAPSRRGWLRGCAAAGLMFNRFDFRGRGVSLLLRTFISVPRSPFPVIFLDRKSELSAWMLHKLHTMRLFWTYFRGFPCNFLCYYLRDRFASHCVVSHTDDNTHKTPERPAGQRSSGVAHPRRSVRTI
jgi:hypothetical protein